MATPANAIFWTGLAYSYGEIMSLPAYPWAILLMIALSCYLLISELPMFSLKFKQIGWLGNQIRWIFIAGSLLLLIFLGLNALPAIIVWYTQLALIVWLFKRLSRPS